VYINTVSGSGVKRICERLVRFESYSNLGLVSSFIYPYLKVSTTDGARMASADPMWLMASNCGGNT